MVIHNIASGADRVCRNAIVSKRIPVLVQIRQLISGPREDAIAAGATLHVEELTSRVPHVSEDERSDDSIAGLRVRIQSLVALLLAVLEQRPATSAEYVPDYLTPLAVPADNEFCVGTPFVVRSDLLDAVGGALSDRVAVRRWKRVVELNILVVAAGQAGADGINEFPLATGVGLVVAASEKDVNILALVRARLLRGSAQGKGCRRESAESHPGQSAAREKELKSSWSRHELAIWEKLLAEIIDACGSHWGVCSGSPHDPTWFRD